MNQAEATLSKLSSVQKVTFVGCELTVTRVDFRRSLFKTHLYATQFGIRFLEEVGSR